MNAQRNRAAAEPQSDNAPQFAPEIESALDRMAEMLQHLRQDPPARNEATYQQPSLFYALSTRKGSRDNVGRCWETPLLAGFGYRFARLKDQLSGVNALSELMHADFQQQQDLDSPDQFSPVMREGLFVALMELAHAANHNMETIADAISRDAARQAGQGGGP